MIYWQSIEQPNFDYSVFVHLVDGSDQLVAQDDRSPGASLGYSPKSWLPRDIVSDEHIIKIPSPTASTTYHVRVGIYNWATGDRLPAISCGQPMDSFITLDEILKR